ncbi:uncharacterized protein LOC101857591 [Aplysia californica]|uniref:Uncharacterized protein LOC101857591 n=1 Tax=Aplysia californica TaxID=6500 RepID=A0ABM1VZG7_APLCA|nr:uncharacterized protein LOC101857591 [Aplysia californica]
MEEGERSPVVAQRPNGQAGAGVWKEPASSKSPASAASTTTPSASAASSSPPSAGRGGAARGGAARGGAARGGGGASASGGFAGLAKMLGSKAKEAKAATASGGTGPGQKSRSVSPRSKKAEHEDDLPLGSEAHSLTDQSNGIDSKPQEPREQRSKWLKTATMMGWQSFNSDVSNQTSASSASLEMLLQERQMDPEQMLMNLGFGGQAPAYVPSLARVPERFLSHPSRAYGIDVQSSTEDGEGDDQGDGGGGGGGGEEAARPGTPSGGVNTSGGGGGGGATTVAKKRTGIWTLARTLSMLRMRSSNPLGHVSPSRSPSGTPPHINSILHPANQRALASRGYYIQQGWPRGTFEEADELAQEESDSSKDAASKRKMFQKARSRRNWSLCDSGENEAGEGGGGGGHAGGGGALPRGSDSSWVTKSLDDLLSGDEMARRDDSLARDDSLGRTAYFSTTTESSTDSLDAPNSDTEKAFEEIRKQYKESQRKERERSSSEDLFLPRRKKRLSSDLADQDQANTSAHGTDLLSAGDFSSNNYFISPASSRQATVEKAPTLHDQSSIVVNDPDDFCDNRVNDNDSNNNSRSGGGSKVRWGAGSDERGSCESSNSDDVMAVKRRTNSVQTYGGDGLHANDVRIIVSGTELPSSEWPGPADGTAGGVGRKSASHLTVSGAQRASSDSGSSSSGGTAVGSSSVATATDDADTLRFSESENSVTDRDSISRTNSPCPSQADRVHRRPPTSSVACQASESDLDTAYLYANSYFKVLSSSASRSRSSSGAEKGNIARLDVYTGRSRSGSGRNAAPDTDPKGQVQLCPLPPHINPVELMKRLHHSQEGLSRMGSVQSDSSGFGDADPSAEANSNQESDQAKMGLMGSSTESGGTLASSSHTAVYTGGADKGEIATQTSVDLDMISQSVAGAAKDSPRPVAKTQTSEDDSNKPARYVSMCYIPPLNTQPVDDLGLRYRIRPGAETHDEPSGTQFRRARGFSVPNTGYFVDEADTVAYLQARNNKAAYPAEPSLAFEHAVTVYDPRLPTYNAANAAEFRRAQNVNNSYFKNQDGISRPQGSRQPHGGQAQSKSDQGYLPRADDSNKIFTSPLYSHQIHPGASRHISQVSYRVRPVRMRSTSGLSDDGLDRDTRNDVPLSEELAQATNAKQKDIPGLSQTPKTSPSASGHTPSTSSTTQISTINIPPSPLVQRTTVTMTTTPKRYKGVEGFNFPPLAGNLSGFESNSRQQQHSTPRDPPTTSRQKSCDILEDDSLFGVQIDGSFPLQNRQNALHGSNQGRAYVQHPAVFRDGQRGRGGSSEDFSQWQHVPHWFNQNAGAGYAYSLPPSALSRTSDDLDTLSSMAETSSDFSIQSSPEGHTKTGVLDARKLARMINQPMYFKGKRRAGAHYRPRRVFKEWSVLGKRKRLQEENRLLQYSLQKYKTELSIMETSFMVDYQAAYDDMTEEEREEVEEMEWLYGEVKGQIMEMEHLLLARVKSVHAGNDFHSLMSSIGVINKMIDLIKEQLYQQQLSNTRPDGEDNGEDEMEDYEDDPYLLERDGRHGRSAYLPSHGWMPRGGMTRRFQSSSTSNLPKDLNVSLEQIKSSLLSEVQNEIRASTRRLEADLQDKDREIQLLKQQLDSSTPTGPAKPRWTPKSTPARPRSRSHGQGSTSSSSSGTHPKPRVIGDRIVQETDV